MSILRVKELEAQLARRDERIAELELDADRYRWLRNQHQTLDDERHDCGDSSREWFVWHGYDPVGSLPGELDEVIDTAMKASDG